jgi:hypothetical protein
MAASQGLPVSGSELREDVVWLGCSCELMSLRCVCVQDASETPRRVSFGKETDVAVVSEGPGSSNGGVDADSTPECVVLHFDFKAFERATSFGHEDAIELWARWNSVVPEERKAGSRQQYISVRIEVSFRSLCACACVLGRSSLSILVLLAWRLCLCETTVSTALESGLFWTSRCFRTRASISIWCSLRSFSAAGSRRCTRLACGVLARRGWPFASRSFLAWRAAALTEAVVCIG